ncbi:hypothetical protein ATANTOWER_005896 [Ataeniobius toweri]|uniref:Secreted protein n=1 Tax=Ataeniobius toweri TaxID=208326 RepID=A0ABU7CD14_9TELE|nr:hypothetical protein [Ataeniobius toweri]
MNNFSASGRTLMSFLFIPSLTGSLVLIVQTQFLYCCSISRSCGWTSCSLLPLASRLIHCYDTEIDTHEC